MSKNNWNDFKNGYFHFKELSMSLDISKMNFKPSFFEEMKEKINSALSSMQKLEAGDISNPDEGRMVGHYWLRKAESAPSEEIKRVIVDTLEKITQFAADIRTGKIRTEDDKKYDRLLVIGIGGSALGPQFVADALADPGDSIKTYFFDNTDPDGIDRVLKHIGDSLETTLCIVISKSGGTKETRNGMLEAKVVFGKRGLKFERNAVAVTGEGSDLDKLAIANGWLARFPMWDWVGGRTSVTSAVGLLPAAIQGIDVKALLVGAKTSDQATRSQELIKNPALLLALSWYHASDGKGAKDMVVLPYKDRLILFSRYLQQLVMESIGKEKNLAGKVVNQGLTVYGNKGSTDQHAYIQQLREGVSNFFATFIEVLKERDSSSIEVEEGITSGDYLFGFLHGTREALADGGRESLTITIDEVSPFTLGVLIALYERAVGYYASFVGINAYHQPGVEAGKKAAGRIIDLQKRVKEILSSSKGKYLTAEDVSKEMGEEDQIEMIFHILRHLAANPGKGVTTQAEDLLWKSRFGMKI